MNDEGNVAVELILAVALVSSIFIPSMTAVADVADARRDVTTAATSLIRQWMETQSQPSVVPLEQSLGRDFDVRYTCAPRCDVPGAQIDVTVKTPVWLWKEVEISHTERLVLNEFG
jgi:hypothetical protein